MYDVCAKVDRKEFPNFDSAMTHCITVEQPAGSAIFVPSGWHHQVENLVCESASYCRCT